MLMSVMAVAILFAIFMFQWGMIFPCPLGKFANVMQPCPKDREVHSGLLKGIQWLKLMREYYDQPASAPS